MKAVGVDLAGKEENPTGLALISDGELRTKLVRSDNEVFTFCELGNPEVVAIDAPLCFPEKGSLRRADAELIKRGYRVLPPVLGGMKSLTQRGEKIAEELLKRGFEVIEIHPRTSGKILFRSKKRRAWTSKLKHRWAHISDATEHEIDATVGALTGLLYLQGKTISVGKKGKEIIIPEESLMIP